MLYQILFSNQNHNAYKSYISQEMVKRILASNTVYTCISDDKGLKIIMIF